MTINILNDEIVHGAVNIILSDKEKYTTTLNYAVRYCEASLNMHGRTLKMQVPYILHNISHWRHPDAKKVRMILKEYLKRSKE